MNEPHEPQLNKHEAVSPKFPKPAVPNKLLLLGAAGVLVAVIGIATWVLTSKEDRRPVQTEETALDVRAAEVKVTSNGFEPSTIKVTEGQPVIWTNTDTAVHQISADPHPTHSSLPGLGGIPLKQYEAYSFTFERSGTYNYHDENNPLKFKGTVIVE